MIENFTTPGFTWPGVGVKALYSRGGGAERSGAEAGGFVECEGESAAEAGTALAVAQPPSRRSADRPVRMAVVRLKGVVPSLFQWGGSGTAEL